jgi:hypothetical protein
MTIDRGNLWENADPTRLEQIAINLLTYAAKYSEGVGHIWFSTGHEGSDIVIRLKDAGIGMFEFVDELFDHDAELLPFAIMTANGDNATRWDDRLSAGKANLLAQRTAVVSLVGNDVLRCEAFQQDLGAGHLVAFPFGQMDRRPCQVKVARSLPFVHPKLRVAASPCSSMGQMMRNYLPQNGKPLKVNAHTT